METTFKSGFVNIIGKPNAGKSTLMNVLTGEKLSVITHKAQTTRRRILGIVTEKNYQVIFSDTPGIIEKTDYKLHTWMNEQIKNALQDADIILFITTPFEKTNDSNFATEFLQKITIPVFVLINKMDAADENRLNDKITTWKKILPGKEIMLISALKEINTKLLFKKIVDALPQHPAYYDADTLTDKTERFFAAEIVREHILKNYKEEIPYSAEVIVEEYKEKETLTMIRAIIYVGRESHKMILIGHNGKAIKQLGTESRIDIEKWIGRKVFLDLTVKVKNNWKNDEKSLKQFGYQ